MANKAKLLFAITVYNGREVVFSCLQSAARMAAKKTTVDVLVLDDASPEAGFSEEVEATCAELGLGYYRSPRNLGIPRNVNLGLLWALEKEYDYVIIANSDVLFCRGLPDLMVEVARTDSAIGSVTAWSNNVSIYSLPNDDPDKNLGNQDTVDWVAASLWGNFGPTALDVPAGISFCILIPLPVLKRVGLMDPVFGRGYCEETDWTLRSKSLGYRVTLAPSCFVYHRGQVSNTAAGLLPTGHTSVPENEDIIDLRYPFFRSQVSAFINSELLSNLHSDASAKVMIDAARQWGYVIEFGQLPRHNWDVNVPVVGIELRDGELVAFSHFLGMTHQIPLAPSEELIHSVVEFFGRDPNLVHIGEPVIAAEALAGTLAGMGLPFERTVGYPTKV